MYVAVPSIVPVSVSVEVVHQTRDAEVGESSQSVGADKDVGRFDVAVHDALGVGVGERVGERRADRRGLGGGERALAQHLVEARAVDELHDEVGHVPVDAGFEELDQSRMREASKGLRLLSEALGVFAVRGTDDLDRDVGAVHLVDGAKDVGHPAAAEQRAESVPSIK